MNTNTIPPNSTESNPAPSHNHPAPQINHDLRLAPGGLKTPENSSTYHHNHQDQSQNNNVFSTPHTPYHSSNYYPAYSIPHPPLQINPEPYLSPHGYYPQFHMAPHQPYPPQITPQPSILSPPPPNTYKIYKNSSTPDPVANKLPLHWYIHFVGRKCSWVH